MQTTITATLVENQSDCDEIKSQLDKVVVLHSIVQRKLYVEIQNYFKQHNVNKLPNTKLNSLKSQYQLNHNINARQFNSIYAELSGKISSILELNKGYLEDTKDNISTLTKSIKSKKKTLNDLIKKISATNYVETNIDKINHDKLKNKLFYLNQKLDKANKKLSKLAEIEKTGNPHLCFGSNKLFRQQFQINVANNLSPFKSFADWKKAWIESRNKSFFLLGSSDETLGNQNCQIKHVENNIYELTVNVKPKAIKLNDRYITFKIQLHNDKQNRIQNILNNDLSQALSYRFYKHNGSYKIFISLDKSKQQPKVISSKLLGTIGIDINADHLAISEVDRFGNLKKSWNIELNLKDKTTEQSLNLIALAVKEITDYAVKVGKPIVIEKLDFSNKKKQLKDSYNKKYNVMLSSLAYSKIIELVKNRTFDKGIEVIEVNPAYTSKIGKFKYQNQYKLTTHRAAAFVIARRGLLSCERYINVKIEKKDKEGKIVESCFERKSKILVNKEKTISIRRSKYYSFALPDRNMQRQNNIYWKEIEQSYLKEKKHRTNLKLKRKELILGNNSSKLLPSELTLVADKIGVDNLKSNDLGKNSRGDRCFDPNLCQPFELNIPYLIRLNRFDLGLIYGKSTRYKS